jgi:hypothetical protein
MIPRLPRRSTDDLRLQADEILREHHSDGDIPVPIETIVESGFGLDIIPIRGFRDRTGAEGGMTVI